MVAMDSNVAIFTYIPHMDKAVARIQPIIIIIIIIIIYLFAETHK
jgi:hypothetical protein